MTLVVVGVSYERTRSELRERAHLAPAQAAALARELAGAAGEAVCLSTCNRTELYIVGEDAASAARRGRDALVRLGGAELAAALEVRIDEDAAAHLMRVAAGLESMVIGESEILGQVRKAHAAGATGAVLDRLFAHAFRAGKRARRETGIGERASSIPAATAALAVRVRGTLSGQRVLVVGAGEMAELAAVALRSRGAGDIVIANRTHSRAESLAARVGGRAAALDALPEELAAADVVVSCTSSRSFVVSPAALARRGARPLLLIDLALPRDVDPGVASLDGHRLFDLDDLARIVGSTLEFRRSEAQRAEAIVHEEAEKFRLWRHSLPAVPALVALRRHAEAIRTSVLERRAGELAALGARERELVESVTSQIVARLLHAPTIELKSGGPDAKAVERLFALQPAISPVRSGDGALG